TSSRPANACRHFPELWFGAGERPKFATVRGMIRRIQLLAVGLIVALLQVTPIAAQEVASPPDYMDDRSTPEAVVISFYNAITLRQFARAYSYWTPAAAATVLPEFEEFRQGYQDTESVQVSTGPAHGSAAAGHTYYTVPVVLAASMRDGT